jgi:hypothetical protein
VFLGADGSKPTGTVPEIYFKGTGDAFYVNSGSGGGDFTDNATLTTPTTTPSNP